MPTATTTADNVHRLSDMLTEEVSLVDRPANRHKFLIVKREEVQMAFGAPVVAGAGGLVTAGASLAQTAAAPTTKAGGALTQEAQDALSNLLEEVSSKLEDAQSAVEGATVVDDPSTMDAAAICSQLMDMSEALEDACYALSGIGEPEQPAAGPAPDAAAPVPVAAAAPPFGKRLAVKRAKRIIAKATGEHVGRTLLAKFGAKLKKERLVRLQEAMNTLASIIGEVSPTVGAAVVVQPVEVDTTKTGAPVIDPKKKPKVPPGAPANPSGPAAANAPPPGMQPSAGTKADASPESTVLTKRIDELQTVVTAQQVVIKKMAETSAAARDFRTPSNAATVDGGASGREETVFWPTDMNAMPERAGSRNRFGE